MKSSIKHAVKLAGQQYSIANKKASKILVKYDEAWVADSTIVDLNLMSDEDSALYEELCVSMRSAMEIQQSLRVI